MLALYDGDDCTSLNCFAGTDDSRPDYSTDLSFQAQANQNYRLLVGNAAGTFAGQGIFTINITVRIVLLCDSLSIPLVWKHFGLMFVLVLIFLGARGRW